VSIASTKRDLLVSLKDKEFRDAFKLENVYTGVCFQIRAIREQQGLSQKALGRLAGGRVMAQERISILEDPNADTKPTLTTLLRVADALDVGLEVRFVPFSKVIDRSVRTDMRELQVAKFDDEVDQLEKQIEFDLRVALNGLTGFEGHKCDEAISPELDILISASLMATGCDHFCCGKSHERCIAENILDFLKDNDWKLTEDLRRDG
jgi:transcriptional regulator with XRE-family HTH domain